MDYLKEKMEENKEIKKATLDFCYQVKI